MAATVKDIAKRANVSKVTVAAVLSGRFVPKRSDAVRRAKRIRRIAEELGYRPNTAARAISRGRFGAVGLILSAARLGYSTLPQELVAGLCAALESQGMHLSVATLSDEELTDESVMPRIMREWCMDGLLVNYNKHTPAGMAEVLDRLGAPRLWLNCKLDQDCIHPNDFKAGREATEHLLAQGHRRIAYVRLSTRPEATEDAHYSEIDRRDGYVAAMRDAGLPAQVVERDPATSHAPKWPEEAVHRLLTAEPRPTALVVYGNRDMTQLVLPAARLGLTMPADLSLVVFADAPLVAEKPVTTWLVPQEAMGRQAVALLNRKIEQPAVAVEPVAVDFTLCEGQTVAPPREPA